MTERRTPLYDFHFRSARNLVKGGGDFMFPTSYTSPVEEHLNARRNVGMQDLSTMGEVDIKGARRRAAGETPARQRGPGHGAGAAEVLHDVQRGGRHRRRRHRLQVRRRALHDRHQLRAAAQDVSLDLRARRGRERLRYRRDGRSRPAGGAGAALPDVPQDRRRGCGPRRSTLLPLRSVSHRRGGAHYLPLWIHGELGCELYTPADQAGPLWEFYWRRAASSTSSPTASRRCNLCASRRACPSTVLT